VLNDTEFYGGLRSLASRSAGLALVIAARRDLEQLNQLTQAINPHGSAYFNVFTEIKLGSLSKEAFSELLKRAEERFDRWDGEYVTAVSGRHPYLAQATGAMLWDAHEEGKVGTARYREVGRALYRETKKHFADTWRSWTNQTRKAITAVALAQIPRLLAEHKFRVGELIEDLADYGAELDTLEAEGMLTQDDEGEWIITQGAFLWWLADELRRNVRDDTEFRACFRNFFTRFGSGRMEGWKDGGRPVPFRESSTFQSSILPAFLVNGQPFSETCPFSDLFYRFLFLIVL